MNKEIKSLNQRVSDIEERLNTFRAFLVIGVFILAVVFVIYLIYSTGYEAGQSAILGNLTFSGGF